MKLQVSAPLVGIFAGGEGRRMGGRDKATLLAPHSDQTLLGRLLQVAAEAGLSCVVVGGAHRQVDVPMLRDEPLGQGPLGGLCALLAHAAERKAIALACDLPYVEAVLLKRLSSTASAAQVLCPRDPETGKWQALFARYDSRAVLPILRAAMLRGVRSFQDLFQELTVEELALNTAEQASLRDWDTPSDMAT